MTTFSRASVALSPSTATPEIAREITGFAHARACLRGTRNNREMQAPSAFAVRYNRRTSLRQRGAAREQLLVGYLEHTNAASFGDLMTWPKRKSSFGVWLQ